MKQYIINVTFHLPRRLVPEFGRWMKENVMPGLCESQGGEQGAPFMLPVLSFITPHESAPGGDNSDDGASVALMWVAEAENPEFARQDAVLRAVSPVTSRYGYDGKVLFFITVLQPLVQYAGKQ